MRHPVLFARRCWEDYMATFNVSPYWRLRDHEERRVPLEMMAVAKGGWWRVVRAEVRL